MPDSQPNPYPFSIFNLLLAMVPLAVVFACISYENRHGRNLLTAVLIVFGLVAVGGTISGGWRGMFRALDVGAGATIAGVVAMILVLSVLVAAAVVAFRM